MTRPELGDGMRAGVLNRRQVRVLFREGIVRSNSKEPEMEDAGSAFDLHLGHRCYEMRGCAKLRTHDNVEPDLIGHHKKAELDLSRQQVLLPGTTYIVEAQEALDLRNHAMLWGEATGKSSIGRLDVLTHLLVNGESRYDTIKGGYVGGLYVQITPLTFPILVSEGMSLNQLRIFCGEPRISEIGTEALQFHDGILRLDRDTPATDATEQGYLSLSLAPVTLSGKNVSAYAAKKENYDESRAIDPNTKGKYDASEYWELINGAEHINTEPERLYIVRSQERLCLPRDVCVTCIAMTENLGDVRIHYAGFAHPTFGSLRDDRRGTPLMFEVRCFTGQVLRHGEIFANLKFYRMSEPVEEKKGKMLTAHEWRKLVTALETDEEKTKGRELTAHEWLESTHLVNPVEETKTTLSAYERQELMLSKVFKEWPAN